MNKTTQEILDKLEIDQLNQMQLDMQKAVLEHADVILLSPTGTGKTLAYLLPILERVNPDIKALQALILVPSRELAIQIESVIRKIGGGFKLNAVYGGRSGSLDRMELTHTPSILIGTPGRVADHIRNETINTHGIDYLVLDEFDKSLELGYEEDMREIIEDLKLEKRILSSATQKLKIPAFIDLDTPRRLDYLNDHNKQLQEFIIKCSSQEKYKILQETLIGLSDKRGIVFCNLKNTLSDLSHSFYLDGIDHTSFYGDLEQLDRERSLIKFRNGTNHILLATDLAARGIDVPDLDYIIHYEIPSRPDEYTHRNGRTARMHAEGIAIVIKDELDQNYPYIEHLKPYTAPLEESNPKPLWKTLFISAGRKDKISKGDIAGLFFKKGELEKNQLGLIELKSNCAYVAVPKELASDLILKLNNQKIKKRKLRITMLK